MAPSGVMEYEAAGYLPEAMVNFLARIGWAHGDDEIFSRAQLVEWFSLRRHQPGALALQLGKLNWVNQEHMKRMPDAALGQRLAPYPRARGTRPIDAAGPDPGAVAALLRDRAETLVAMADQAVVLLLDALSIPAEGRNGDHAGDPRGACRAARRVRVARRGRARRLRPAMKGAAPPGMGSSRRRS